MSRRSKDSAPSKRQQLREERMRAQRQQRLIVIVGVVGVSLLIIGVLLAGVIRDALTPVGEIVKPEQIARPQASSNSMGDPNAPVKILEFSDFQCPFCKRFSDETEMSIVEAYVKTGKVYFTYVPYGPGGQWIGRESERASIAAFCAGDQGKFWEMKDVIFANHTGENVGDYTDKRLEAFAEYLELDMNAFTSCFSSSKFSSQINDGIAQGIQAGFNSTPSFLVNGRQLIGAQPFSEFQREIEAALQQAGQ